METKQLGYKKIKSCRISSDNKLVSVLNLGHQYLTGVFPKLGCENEIISGPLELVWSSKSGLLQLSHSYDSREMYGENYGYRSSLNESMVSHLRDKVAQLEKLSGLSTGDTVLDIGSNDATTLKAYSTKNIQKIGIDPTGKKFAHFYPKDINLVTDFFNEKNYKTATNKQAKIITSIAMFYDLEDPIKFAEEVSQILADDGIWHLEQSYMPAMLKLNSYDTICHEHIEYYSLGVMQKIMSAAGLKIIDVTLNKINGGSFTLTCVKKGCSKYPTNQATLDSLLLQELQLELHTPKPYKEFEERTFKHRNDLTNLIKKLVADGKKVLGYGASTKGNVVLQFCGFTSSDIPAIAEVNQDKFGCMTPGTKIPIISEQKAKELKPDYFLVLPWHFKDNILKREKEMLSSGVKFIFPFPEIEII